MLEDGDRKIDRYEGGTKTTTQLTDNCISTTLHLFNVAVQFPEPGN